MSIVTKLIPYALAFAGGIAFTSCTDLGGKVGSKVRQLIKGTAA